MNGCIECGRAIVKRRNDQKEQNKIKAIEYAKAEGLKRIVITQTPRGIYRFKPEDKPLADGHTISEYLLVY